MKKSKGNEAQLKKSLEATRHSAHSDAAALQNDIARKYNLPGASNMGLVKFNRKNIKSSIISDNTDVSISCGSCNFLNEKGSITCRACGYFLLSAKQPVMTLAQKKGLVDPSPKNEILALSEWNNIEAKLDQRNESTCPICMVPFNQGNEVLLSCSHIFHRMCLASFENFMQKKERCCPICRTANYQKKITTKGSDLFQIVCTIKIQSLFRGYLSRKVYHSNLRKYYRQGKGITSQRKKFYEKELVSVANRITEDVEKRKSEVDSVLSNIDSTMMDGRELDDIFNSYLQQRLLLDEAKTQYNLSRTLYDDTSHHNYRDEYGPYREEKCDIEIDEYNFGHDHDDAKQEVEAYCTSSVSESQWKAAFNAARSRGTDECAICMSSYHGSVANRTPILLSCSHVFHKHCITNFEKFVTKGHLHDEERSHCPVCRSIYEKREFM